ncbi:MULTISPECIES: plasmid partitioning protein RepB [Methylorubrum]|uniref:plasmid partitioning protein RepB n=1 Tax=Methylorubrum TaxID=2282523 RepID=UPI0020A16C56|nr:MULTISPECIES: plasmid partitioning protein RepB [Methylorubrum]MCJ2029520.1 plasmid partitioning protein RepB [Methylobacterium sp. J-043]MDF9861159.1 ParB family chromosome partitioning protein [Methylorubrum pseudosasae]MDH6640011.1 ParB family chromosome partitioning protein [Methylobacterium sp. SuP10 SLI 274]MCP1551498.1 ParB family chromosome partitioning protein [Methylorubrum zatmanii]MCP1556435.1 ParB family chromosome partitioning protein [Methylorubrum extorquens]
MASLWLAQTAPALAEDGVVELDPNLCDPSAIADRVPDATDAAFTAFVDQVREEGQHTPILVRKHPAAPGRYEIAYGRRRTRAAREIGKPVRAVVRDLSDAELVVAQGSENLAREDLSYIERAHFARNMEQAGVAREVILKAMGVHRPDLVNYLAVAEAIPAPVLAAIGPAPKIGRPRWLTLADRIQGASPEQVDTALASPDLAGKPSDERFAVVLTALTAAPKPARKPKGETMKDSKGMKFARVERSTSGVRVTTDEKIEPGFGDYLAGRLHEILAAYRASKG